MWEVVKKMTRREEAIKQTEKAKARIMKLVEQAQKAFESANRAEKQLERARERASRARRRRQRTVQRFLSEYRRITGLSIRETQKAIGWMSMNLDPEMERTALERRKQVFKEMIDEASDWADMMAVINRMAYEARKIIAFKNLANYEELLSAAWQLGYLTDSEIAIIMKYGGKEVD